MEGEGRMKVKTGNYKKGKKERLDEKRTVRGKRTGGRGRREDEGENGKL